ncbi:redoxin domain-containing protein [Clostridium sp. D2Q-11]|uniref:Redoxin domain-containing protein n=1 Tax=Anaeromonas frigoriresistens TaxID=2683708 RepID=A0A942UV17_9FIRM|nr:redoxin domain-containing protein [Anaeromonas frigoriresistens]
MNNYWYYNPYCIPYQNSKSKPIDRYNEKNYEYPNCVIKEKYCDYFDIGDKAPNFTLEGIVNCEPKEVSLSDYLGSWAVLFFYGSDFTFV